MFYFILHFIVWREAQDSEIIFHAVRLESGIYRVSWVDEGVLLSRTYSAETVTGFLANRKWIMTDEYGNY